MPKKSIDPKVKSLLKACDTFGRACKIIDGLPPGHEVPDDRALREVLPGGWPIMGELRDLLAQMEKLGWTSETFR